MLLFYHLKISTLINRFGNCFSDFLFIYVRRKKIKECDCDSLNFFNFYEVVRPNT